MRIFPVVAIIATSALGAAGQQVSPQKVNTGDLIQGYVPLGSYVVTTGHLAFVKGQALLNPALPSAMAPAIVDITRLPSANRDKVETQCAAVQITSGGCWAQVQGHVQQIDARPGLVATDIELLVQIR